MHKENCRSPSLPIIGVVFFLAVLNSYVMILTKILICTSLITNKHPFMCLFAYILFGAISCQACCPFLNWVVVFLLLSFESSLYIVDISHLSDMWVTHIFPNIWFIFKIIIARVKVFNLDKVHFTISAISEN